MSSATITAAQLATMRATLNTTMDLTGTRRRFPIVTDRYNDATRDTAHPQDVAIILSMFEETATENRNGRDEQISQWKARVPAGTDITGRDQVIIAGAAYEVIGQPIDFSTHLTVQLRLVQG